MKSLIGNNIEVYLKSTDGNATEIYGILIEVTESELYVQCANINKSFVWVVPRDNVKYCTIPSMPMGDRMINTYREPERQVEEEQEAEQEPEEQEEPPEPEEKCLTVFIDGDMLVSIPVPPTFNISTWSDNIMRVLAGNPDVKSALAGRTQKSIEYFPGEVYIELIEGEKQAPPEPDDFSMGGNIATEYLNPIDMVTRFNGMLKKGKQNGNS